MSQELRAALELSLGAGYRIERELGRDGMSRVLLGNDGALGACLVAA